MTWQVGNLSGSVVVNTSTWRVANVSGAVLSRNWRVAKLSGTIGLGGAKWRVGNLSGSVAPQKWRVANIGGTCATGTTPVLAAFSTQTIDPIYPCTITAVVSNGIAPDSFSFTSPGITFAVSGNTATFTPPGSNTGGTISVTVTATKGANTSAPQTATFLVRRAFIYSSDSLGNLRASSNPYSA